MKGAQKAQLAHLRQARLSPVERQRRCGNLKRDNGS
jgi:hypothetical protein